MKQTKKPMEWRGKAVFLALFIAGVVLAVAIDSLLDSCYPTFGGFWETVAVLVVAGIVSGAVRTALRRPRPEGLTPWLKDMAWNTACLLIYYLITIGLERAFGNDLAQASRFTISFMFFFLLPEAAWNIWKERNRQPQGDDLYTQAMREMEQKG